jgi:hypothetical protein
MYFQDFFISAMCNEGVSICLHVQRRMMKSFVNGALDAGRGDRCFTCAAIGYFQGH